MENLRPLLLRVKLTVPNERLTCCHILSPCNLSEIPRVDVRVIFYYTALGPWQKDSLSV